MPTVGATLDLISKDLGTTLCW